MQNRRIKYRLFYKLEEHLEIPMFVLAIFWLYLFVVELTYGLSNTQEYIIFIIWILFILEFLIKLFLTPRKLTFVKNSWITIVALVIPALRVFRIFAAFRILRTVRVINSTRIIRALTSGKRFFSALKEAQGPQPSPEMNVGIIIASGIPSNKEQFIPYATQLGGDVKQELDKSTGLAWSFEITDEIDLPDHDPRGPSDFLDNASLIMAEGSYDLICVLTDVPLLSRRNRIEAGLLSEVARIVVISTHKLVTTSKKHPTLQLNNNRVRINSALLFLHLTGHLLGLKHTSLGNSKIMGRLEFDQPLKEIPSFTKKEKAILKKKAKHAPERELKGGNYLESFVFHILMTLRHPKNFFSPLLKNWAVLLPLSLPGLATAAVAPAIILIFNAEIWDVSLGMTNLTAGVFAVISIMFGSFYLVRVQSLFLPRKDKNNITEHIAVTNSVIYCSIFLACIGLFVMVGGLVMIVEIYVFPEDLLKTWPTLGTPVVLLEDRIRLAVFISTIGVTTGALAGGLESRKVIQHLALFRKRV